jgi:methionyl-tRNA formyltransferase
VEAAILAGDQQTGISLMQMDAGLDTGAVYLSDSIDIGEQETAGELHERLAVLGGELLVANLQRIADGDITAGAQDQALASYAGKFRQADARIDWRQPAQALQRTIRAYNPRPGAWFMIDGERVKCWKAELAQGRNAAPGTVLSADSSGVLVACHSGALNLLQLQRPGRKPISAAEFSAQLALNGVTLPE